MLPLGYRVVCACVVMAILGAMLTYTRTTRTATTLLRAGGFSLDGLYPHSQSGENLPSPTPCTTYCASYSQADADTPQAARQPIKSVVFLKTHKTGSSTIASILQRYGYLNKLTFLVPRCRHILTNYKPLNITNIHNSNSEWNLSIGFDLLTNHARYNRPEMDRIFHGSKYITILRDPATQFESSFYYFEMFKLLPAGNNSLGAFFTDPNKHFKMMQERSGPRTARRMHNQQLFDLGIGLNDMSNDDLIDSTIEQFSHDFDLILINEYFDESLLLLRKLLKWNISDIRYISKAFRSPHYRYNMTDNLRRKIRKWNSADYRLYQSFNKTFWDKVKEYGPQFHDDLNILRQHQQELKDTCCDNSRTNTRDRRVVNAILKDGAPDWCSHFMRSDAQFTALIRKRMKKKGIPLYDACVPA